MEKIKLTRELIDSFNTDSDITDYAEKHNISEGKLFEEIAQFNAKGTVCYGCQHVTMYDDMYPCNCCSRTKKDMFERRINYESIERN